MICEKCNSEMTLNGFKFLDSDLVEQDFIWKCKKCLNIQYSKKVRITNINSPKK